MVPTVGLFFDFSSNLGRPTKSYEGIRIRQFHYLNVPKLP